MNLILLSVQIIEIYAFLKKSNLQKREMMKFKQMV